MVTVGGGLGGASLARALAADGLRVLVLERETAFRDRIRGEQIHPWGLAEAKSLGVYDLLKGTCAHELPWWDMFLGDQQMAHREIAATTPQALPEMSFYHPEMQEILLQGARDAGAEVRRGAQVRDVTPGDLPELVVESDAGGETIRARLVVGADGRNSTTRKSAGFEVRKDPPNRLVAGLLLDQCPAKEDTSHAVINPVLGRLAVVFPQGDGRARCYLVVPDGSTRFQGEGDVPRFIEESIRTGAPSAHFEGVTPAGPLATFDGRDTWVEHPYKEGVALIGDAAAANDPSFGEGLSLTLRDARLLRDAIKEAENDDWDGACHAYAEAHDRSFRVIHDTTGWFGEFFLSRGAKADARRARALPLIAQDPTRIPDHPFSGPDLPCDETTRKRFFGEI